MVYLNSTAFYVCHIPNQDEGREKNFQSLRSSLLPFMDEFNGTTISLKNQEDLDTSSPQFSDVEVKRHVYKNVAMNDGTGRLLGDPGTGEPYSDVEFPKKFGEIGLLASVYVTLRNFLESEYEALLWLENDTVTSSNFEEKIELYLALIDFEFDIVSLGVPEHQKSAYIESLHYSWSKVYSRVYQWTWAGALLISREGAQKLVDLFREEGFTYPFDWLTWNIRDTAEETPMLLNTYSLRPEFANLFYINEEVNSKSTIDATQKMWE